MLQNGLEKLGIGVQAEVADALLHILGSSTTASFGARDLASFCTRRGIRVGKLFEIPASSHHVPTRDLPAGGPQSHEPVSNQRVLGSSDRVRGEIVDTTMKERGRIAQVRETHPITDGTNPSATRSLSCSKFTNTSLPVSDCSTGRKKLPTVRTRGVYSSPSPTFPITRDSAQPTSSIQLHNMISTLTVNGSHQQEVTRRHPWEFLPYWARDSSRRALLELMGNHKR